MLRRGLAEAASPRSPRGAKPRLRLSDHEPASARTLSNVLLARPTGRFEM
jgi:hypothetical protein